MIIKWTRAISTLSCLALGTLAVGCGEMDGVEAAGEETVVSAIAGQSPVAYQSSDHLLKVDLDQNFVKNSGNAMASGTVPSQVKLPDGSIEIGFQRDNGIWAVDNYKDGRHSIMETKGTIRGGTSPSLALCPTTTCGRNWAFGFNGSDGHLWIGEGGFEGNGKQTAALMAGGTSPSLGMKSDKTLVFAIQSTDGHMWVSTNGPSNGVNSKALLAGGTSPGIAVGGPADTIGIAFQGATNGHLWMGPGTFLCNDKGYVVKAGTSPTVAVSGDGKRTFVAYQASSDNRVHVYRYDITVDPMKPAESDSQIALGMSNSASPRIMAVSSRGYQIAAKDANGNLWVVSNPTGDIGGDFVEDSNLPMN